MPGSVEGGRKAAATNKRLYGENWYQEIGKIGGATKGPKGFGANPELARKAGAHGGRVSTRAKNIKERPSAAYCWKGHERTDENTITYPSGAKRCKDCMRLNREAA